MASHQHDSTLASSRSACITGCSVWKEQQLGVLKSHRRQNWLKHYAETTNCRCASATIRPLEMWP